MRVFISCVDSAFGHNISRLLSQTAIGSRKEQEEDNEAEEPREGGAEITLKPKEYYSIIGTFVPQPKLIEDGVVVERPYLPPTLPGPMHETGDKKKDSIRRESIDKFAVLGKKPLWVKEIIKSDDRECLMEALLQSDIIVYDLVQSLDEATWAIEMLSDNADNFLDSPKTFVAISTIMTWAKTKIDLDDPDAFLTEDDYRRRKAHPNFKAHVAAEKLIIKCGKKSALRNYVISSGLVYHSQESIFHYLLKAAWHNSDELICYGDGTNIVPTIHLDDLCNIVVEVIETTPETKYLLAVDESKNTWMEICKTISEALGNGKIKKVSKEFAFLNKNIPQSHYDMLLVNLRLEPGHVKDMSFEWRSESGLIENISQLIQEYKDARGLSPLKIVVHGPPACGKTYFAKKIADYYEIHFIEVQKVIHDAVNRLERRAAGRLNPEENDDDIESDRELLEEIRESASKNNGRYADEHIITFVRDKLKSMPCRNQGYILDSFPTNIEEARELFK
ncbi:Adenylate kinase 7, partial [Nowakowskiella sp. JEL0078]